MPDIIATCNEYGCDAPRTARRSVCEFHGIRCGNCNTYTVRGRAEVSGRYGQSLHVCLSCYEDAPACINCDRSISAAYMYSVGDDHSCHACYNDATHYCTDCDIRVWSNGSHVCPPRSGLRSWDYRPMVFETHGTEGGPTFGVELEVGVRGWNAGAMEELGEGLIWAKRDGSVESSDGYEGSELVSHPMTLNWFQGEGMRRWENILGFVGENGGVNRTCGMHVHVGGENIGRINGHLATLMYLWNTNDEAIRRFCRRVANRYAATSRVEDIQHYIERPDRQDRYALVNLANLRSGGTGTVEFRGFAATTDTQTFRASVEIVAASVEFTREYAGQAAGADWDTFGAWIFIHGETYPALAAEWLVREVYDAYRAVPQGLRGLVYDLQATPAPYGYTRTGRVRQAPSEARRAAAARRYRDPQTGRLATAPEGWTPAVTIEDEVTTVTIQNGPRFMGNGRRVVVEDGRLVLEDFSMTESQTEGLRNEVVEQELRNRLGTYGLANQSTISWQPSAPFRRVPEARPTGCSCAGCREYNQGLGTSGNGQRGPGIDTQWADEASYYLLATSNQSWRGSEEDDPSWVSGP